MRILALATMLLLGASPTMSWAASVAALDIQVAVLDSGPGTIANGNERLEAGETVRLVFRIVNTGRTDSGPARLILSSEGGGEVTASPFADQLKPGQAAHVDAIFWLPDGTEPEGVALSAQVGEAATTWRLIDGYFIVINIAGGADEVRAKASRECPDLSTIEGLTCLAGMRRARAEAIAKAERERRAKIEADRLAKIAAEDAARNAYLGSMENAFRQMLDLKRGGLLGADELRQGWQDFLTRYPVDHKYENPFAVKALCEIGPGRDSGEPCSLATLREDGTILDSDTGLLWQQDSSPGTGGGLGSSPLSTVSFLDARRYCVELNLARIVGWRLPTAAELSGLAQKIAKGSVYYTDGVLAKFDQRTAVYWAATGSLGEIVQVSFTAGFASRVRWEEPAVARCVWGLL